jgi:hypothetical protein
MNTCIVVIFVLLGTWELLAGAFLLVRVTRAESPRLGKRILWKMVPYCVLPLCPLLILEIVLLPREFALQLSVVFAYVLGLAGFVLYWSRRRFTQKETLANYAYDSAHCGRCEYDLTGNTGSICPECGWLIPTGSHPYKKETVFWTVLFGLRPIDHLVDWHQSLRELMASQVALVVLVAVMAWIRPMVLFSGVLLAVLIVLLAVYLRATSRVIHYGRQHASQSHITIDVRHK